MAENQLEPPLLGVSWDGTGLGLDGAVWGGEFLSCRDATSPFERTARLRTFRLPGGESAIRQPCRTALGMLFEIWGRMRSSATISLRCKISPKAICP